MTVKLIAENILVPSDFLSATEQEGEHIGQPVPNVANTGAFRLLSKGTIADFTYSGTCTGEVPDTTSVIDSVLAAFGDDYFIGGTVTFTGGDNNGETRAVTDFAQATGDLTCAAFTNVVNIGDTFILTVAYSTRDFRVELVGSGDAGDATFKWSHDEGTTYLGRDSPNQADWLAEHEIYDDSGQAAVITQAKNGDIVCVIRQDADGTIYRTISTDLGITWGAISQIDATGGISPQALITLSSGRLYLLLGSTAMYSDDNGDTWASKFSLGVTLKDIIELSNGNLIGTNDGGNNIYVVISSDGGLTFSIVITVSTAANDQQNAVLVVAENGALICVYDTDEDAGGDVELKCKISTDNGATWGSTINVINYPGQDVEYPSVIRDIDGRIIVAAQEMTGDQKIVFSSSTDNGATWAAKQDLKAIGGDDLIDPDLCLVDNHLIFCLYINWTDDHADFVRRGIWEAFAANACPCATEAQEQQRLICDVGIVWRGGAGVAGDKWSFTPEYDYGMINLIEDSPSKPWRSEQDNIVCSIVIDFGANERFLVTGIGFFGCNIRTLSFQMNATDAWGAHSVNEPVSFDLATGTVDAVSANAIQDTSLLAGYQDHELSDYYLRMTSGADNGLTWKIKDNVGNYILLDTTAATNILATHTFVIFQSWIAHTFIAGLYQYMRIYIPAQHTAEDYYQIGTIVMGRPLSLTRGWTRGYEKRHQYDIEMLRTPQAGIIPVKGAERKRIFTLSWGATQTTRQELTSLLDYVDGKNICLIPNHSDLNDCYLVKHIGNLNMIHRVGSRFDIKSLIFEEIL